MSKGDTRCVDGRLMRHDPQHDDPYLETDIGKCPECEGAGCDKPEPCGHCGASTPEEIAMRCTVNGAALVAGAPCHGEAPK